MGKMVYLMGKSSTGKDTVYKRLLEKEELKLETIVPYTTRPIRAGEEQGEEYFFTDEDGYRNLSRLVYLYVEDVIHIGLVFEPSASVGDNSILVAMVTRFVYVAEVVDAGGTHELRYDNTLSTVNNEGTVFGHEREIAHIDVGLL